jgi:hypothetical protein
MAVQTVSCPFQTFTSPGLRARLWLVLFSTMAGMRTTDITIRLSE